jgi:hypothetical protein
MEESGKNNKALDALFWRDEILQVMYWLEGEKLDEWVKAKKLKTLLTTDMENLLYHLENLVDDNYLIHENVQFTEDSGFQLAEKGKEEAGHIFAEAFQGMQKMGHGECSADCDCQWEGHDSCKHHHH